MAVPNLNPSNAVIHIVSLTETERMMEALSDCEVCEWAQPKGHRLLLAAVPRRSGKGTLWMPRLLPGGDRREGGREERRLWMGAWLIIAVRRGEYCQPQLAQTAAISGSPTPFTPASQFPQKDPTFYDTYLRTYNAPELVCGPVTVREDELARAILSEPVDAVSRATRPVANDSK